MNEDSVVYPDELIRTSLASSSRFVQNPDTK